MSSESAFDRVLRQVMPRQPVPGQPAPGRESVRQVPAPDPSAPSGSALALASGASAHPETEEAERLVGELREATRKAGIERDDPMMPLLAAFARAIRFMAERGSASDRTVTGAGDRITQAIQSAKQSAEVETRRFQESIRSAEAQTVHDISTAIAHSADRALTRRIKVFDRNTALTAAGVLFAVAAVCLGGGFWWGSSNADGHIHEAEAELQAAFANGPKGAQIWAALMDWNNIEKALHTCQLLPQTGMFKDRKACNIALWIDKPPPIPPDQIQIDGSGNSSR